MDILRDSQLVIFSHNHYFYKIFLQKSCRFFLPSRKVGAGSENLKCHWIFAFDCCESRWSYNTPHCFMLQKPVLSAGSFGPVVDSWMYSTHGLTRLHIMTLCCQICLHYCFDSDNILHTDSLSYMAFPIFGCKLIHDQSISKNKQSHCISIVLLTRRYNCHLLPNRGGGVL